jgi:hypothetical protein
VLIIVMTAIDKYNFAGVHNALNVCNIYYYN